jgi:hypothetical protein
MTNSAPIVQIVTWNDFGEGTMVEPTREYGFRDLGILQDLRRQYLQPNFSFRTNDFALALDFYKARSKQNSSAAPSAQLDNVFTNLLYGRTSVARQELGKLAKP